MRAFLVFLMLAAVSVPLYALTLLWAPAEDADGYRVYHSTSIVEGWELLEDIGPRTPSSSGYVEYNMAEPDVLTLYQVRAYNTSGEIAMEHIFTGFDPETTLPVMPRWTEERIGGKR